jgi:hypothetical protein
MHQKEIQRNAFSIGNQGSNPGKEIFLLLTAKPYAASRPRRVQRSWIPALGHRLGGIALCGLAATAMQPGEAQAQANIIVSIPEGTATIWSLNGTDQGDTNYLNENFGNDNSVSFSVSPLSGNQASSFQTTISGLSTTLIPNTYTPTVTSLEVTLTNATAAAITNANFAFSSTGGQSTIDSLVYPNSGSNLDLTANGVGATVYLNDSSPIYEAYLVQSQGEIGLAAVDVTSDAANGGQITASINSAQGLPTSILVAGQSYAQTGLSWLNPPAGIQASSIGGFGAAGSTGAGTDKFYDWSGDGGDGGPVDLTVGDITINLGLADDPLFTSPQAPVAGILATSQGGSVGPCCTWYNNQGSTITLESDPGQIQFPIGYGQNGDGGSVTVDFSGSISGDAANTFGIVATSLGGSTQLPEGLSDSAPAGASGLGGDVTVNLTGAEINLGPSSVGIFAGSLGAQVNIPSSMSVAGLENLIYPGTVTVSLDDNSSILLGELPGGSLSAGIVAVSSTGWQVQPFGQQIQGSSSAGNGGVVTVSNAGSITSYAESTIGIAALSLGNGGIIANAPASTSTTNYISTTNQGAIQPASAETVTVTNAGSISLQGDASIGILAASNGAGGLVTGIPDAAFSTSMPDGTNISIGSQPTGYVAGGQDSTFTAPGGAVTVTNEGSITTESGNVAIGIIAQSVGGGGATYTEGVALFVGDAGGQGGDGGPITLTNSGPVTTAGDGSIGFLGQSIGGGGGHGANTRGLFVAVGGNGGNGGAGGAINATLQGGSSDTPAIFSTGGDFASGMLLQSIGGGGGNGGYGKAHGIFWSSGIGGAGGSGGAGGDISITTTDSSGIQSATSGNQSHGLMLQSIGGGGGNGGHAYSTAVGLYFAGAVGVGGSGGSGGAGGSLNLLNLCPSSGSSCSALTGTIATGGYDSVGVLLQSIGGGGGYGGGAIAEAYAAGVDTEFTPATVSLATSVGGNGGTGGDGNAISMVSGLTVSTKGTGSHAIAAQSIGGGGGAAADSTAGANSYGNTDFTFNAAVGLGGNGGAAGAGGTIELTTLPSMSTAPQLSTQGHNAIAILAQSIGGGGGYGSVGNAYANDVSVGDTQVALSFALGGSGGAGGSGGDVTISTGDAAITTVGSQSPGILAQSIGGGGGVAGNGGAQSVGGNHMMNVAVGGKGGSGSTAGNVTITNSANITTGIQLDLASGNTNNFQLSQPIVIGSDSPGILAQSIGGGGGIGGNADPTASLIGSVQSLLNEGAGDYVNSTGAYQYFTSTSASAPINYNGTIAIGGTGGNGGDGQAVSVTHQDGLITTFGHRSYGILAQSIGGGGGIGGSSTASSSFLTGSASATILTGFNLGLGINVGGSSGSGGSGGDVNITLDNAQIITAGYGAHAVLGQSIGGGGGAAHDGSIFSASGNISTRNPTIKIGSLTTGGGMQGAGGSVLAGYFPQPDASPVVQQPLTTLGDGASAVLLQSIGGGGGIAGFGCSNSGDNGAGIYSTTKFGPSACFQNASSTAENPQDFLVPSPFQPSPGVQGFEVSIQAAAAPSGSSSGANSAGGNVNYNYSSALTLGNRSIAIVAQSIGGGGGYVSAPAPTITSATLPSSGSNNSSGGDVTINLNSQQSGNGTYGVTTAGQGAWGILAQSIGGGGGFIGDSSFTLTEVPKANSAAGSSSNAVIANGGNITINIGSQQTSSLQPEINTLGEFAHGIVAQSIGAGGGITNVGNQSPFVGSSFAGSSASADTTYLGVGGNIQINIYGSIVVNSYTSMGVFAQSSGTTYPNGPTSQPINIYLNGPIEVSSMGSQADTPSTGAAIMLSGGSSDSTNPNTIYVDRGGSIYSFNTPAENTTAIVSDSGYTIVTNYGTINGSIDLNGQGEINNYANLNTGTIVSVSQNSLHNYGLMRIGALETISRTDLEGRFVQHDTGTLELTIDSTAEVKSDYLNVSGPILLSGKVIPRTNALLRDEIEFAAADSILLNAWVPSNFLLYDWQLRSRGNKLSIKPVADFTPDSVSLTSNQHSLATYLQRSWDQGEPSDASLFSYFHTFAPKDADNYVATLKQIGGMALNSQPIQMKTSFSTALSESLTCPTVTPEGLKPNQQHCVWARATGDYSTQASNDSNSGYWVSAPGIRLGGQRDLGHGWTAGLALGYATNYLRSDNFSSDGDFFDVAVSARKQLGNWELGGSLAFAQGWFENSRTVFLPARGSAAQMGGDYSSDSSLSMLGLRLRAAYNHQAGSHQFKPYLDVDLSQSWMPAYRESTGDLSLQSSGSSDFNVAITPMVEYTLYSTGKGGSGFKAFVSAGASWLPDNRVTTPMSFRADQLDNGSFDVVTDGPTLLGRLNVGAEASISENLEVRAEYNLQMGGGYRSQGISANLRYRF